MICRCIRDAQLGGDAPVDKRKVRREAIGAEKSTPLLQPPPAEPGAHLKPLSSADGIGAIVAQPGQTSRPAKAEMQPQLGPDYDDEEEVPPLL